MKLLVDVDDTISATQAVLIERVNAITGRNYTHEGMSRAHREASVTGGERAEDIWTDTVQEILKDHTVMSGSLPFDGALDAMKTLTEAGHEVHIVSSRKEPLHNATENWLNQHGFGDFIYDIHPRPSSLNGTEFKVRTAIDNDLKVAFDDTFEVALALSGVCSWVYLIDQPWNRGAGCEDLPPNVLRCTSFAMAAHKFLRDDEWRNRP